MEKMKMQLFIFYILFIYIFSFDEESIIKIPNKIGKIKNIPTRKGFINYEFHLISEEEFMASVICVEYNIEGIIKEKEPETITITERGSEIDSRNKDICKMFYKYNYIDNLIYAIDSKYKYFGGLPIHIDSSFEKFTFNNKMENVTEITFELNNGTKIIKNLNYKFEITEHFIGLVYLPEEIFSILYDIFLKDCEKDQYGLVTMYDRFSEGMVILNPEEIFKVNNEQKKLFPNIWFKIGNKKFLINGFNALHSEELYIIKGHWGFTFGQDFLNIFDIREFNIASGEINLYINKKNPHIKVVEEKNNLKKKSNKEQGLPFLSIVIIIFMSVITVTTFYFHRKYHKKIKIDYYNYYYNV
jgi:hypothetical protein